MTEISLKKDIAYKGKFLELHSDQVQLPNGKTAIREYITHPGSVAAIPVLENGDIVLVKQFRYPAGEVILEIPAGKMEKGEAPESAIRRELAEEIGYYPKELIHLVSYWTSPGFCNEILHLYLAKGLIEHQETGDDDEFIETVQMSQAELIKLTHSGGIIDGKTVLAMSYLNLNSDW